MIYSHPFNCQMSNLHMQLTMTNNTQFSRKDTNLVSLYRWSLLEAPWFELLLAQQGFSMREPASTFQPCSVAANTAGSAGICTNACRSSMLMDEYTARLRTFSANTQHNKHCHKYSNSSVHYYLSTKLYDVII